MDWFLFALRSILKGGEGRQGRVATEDARMVFYALTMLLQRPPLLLFNTVERGNGFEA